ncbi:hypothetical protein SAMN04487943_10753 [Gracilibacillus orientalis]|uniref:Uncharacterized protein n=1 Tax=Gracilibacillus orientalis TaxID=334253 RepID=A0A1I4MS96_9BACI|nr:hypothetical protein SAMN04487943_10753 [Gracilibacillus orientalis]
MDFFLHDKKLHTKLRKNATLLWEQRELKIPQRTYVSEETEAVPTEREYFSAAMSSTPFPKERSLPKKIFTSAQFVSTAV